MGEQVAAGIPSKIKQNAYSSVGRAPALQAGGREFESLCLHGIEIKLFRFKRGKQSIPVEIPRIAKRFLDSNLRSKLYGTLKTEH